MTTFEEKILLAGYKPDFSYFDRVAIGDFYRFGPSKSHWIVKNTNGSIVCGDWRGILPMISHGESEKNNKKYEALNFKIYDTSIVDSPYLSRKGVVEIQKKLSGVLVAKDHLCVPISDVRGFLISYQKIYNDGKKKFLSGHPIKGGCYIIGDLKENNENIVFCEGLATGCSIWLSTSYTTVITFGTSNLKAVVNEFKKRFPNSKLLIAGDKGNGEDTARKVASEYECHLAIPIFKDVNSIGTDFNDLQQEIGKDGVKVQIEEGFRSLPLISDFPIKLLEDCFDEEKVLYKKYKLVTNAFIKEIWIKGEDFSDKKKIEGYLKKYGFFYEREDLKNIITYMEKEAPQQSYIMNNECGWRENDEYYLPPLDKPCVNTHYKPFERKGNLVDFKESIFPLARNNPLIIFILSYSFLPLFLKDFNIANFGIHLYGQGSTGKTTLLKLASSIWGNQVEQWNGTLIGLEDLAYRHKDTLFCLDEINQSKIDNIYQLIYMLGNGGGRIRFRSKEIFQSRPKFRINYLSSGESSMEDKLKDEFTGGHSVRIIDINCHRSSNSLKGIFDFSHDSKKDIKRIEQISEKFKNVAIDHLLKNFQDAKNLFGNLNISNDLSGQVGRIKDSFIAIEKAGIVAKDLGCLPDLDISGSIKNIFEGLHKNETTSHEIEIAKKRIYNLVVSGESFFYGGGEFERIPYKIKGYKRGSDFFLTIPTLKQEICNNINYLSTKNSLIKENIIEEAKVYLFNKKSYRAHQINTLWLQQYEEI